MNKSLTYKNLFDGGITTYHRDGSKTLTYMNLIDGGFTSYHPDGSRSITYRNLFDGGYTTYHPDGSRSITYRNLIDGGYTTYHPDGSRSVTYRNLIDGGYTTYYLGDDEFGIGFFGEQYGNSPGGWLGSSVEQISNDLLAVDANLSKQLKSIENECSKMTVAINQIQVAFGNQEAGRLLIEKLYQTIRDLMAAEGVLFIAKKKVRDYVKRVRD